VGGNRQTKRRLADQREEEGWRERNAAGSNRYTEREYTEIDKPRRRGGEAKRERKKGAGSNRQDKADRKGFTQTREGGINVEGEREKNEKKDNPERRRERG
jgi:hypothetical protein